MIPRFVHRLRRNNSAGPLPACATCAQWALTLLQIFLFLPFPLEEFSPVAPASLSLSHCDVRLFEGFFKTIGQRFIILSRLGRGEREKTGEYNIKQYLHCANIFFFLAPYIAALCTKHVTNCMWQSRRLYQFWNVCYTSHRTFSINFWIS